MVAGWVPRQGRSAAYLHHRSTPRHGVTTIGFYGVLRAERLPAKPGGWDDAAVVARPVR